MKDTMNISMTLEQFEFVRDEAQSRINYVARMWSTGYDMDGVKEEIASLLKLKEEVELRIRDWDNRELIS